MFSRNAKQFIVAVAKTGSRNKLWRKHVVCSLLQLLLPQTRQEMNPQTDKIVRRTTMVATAVASYFLLTGDYGPEPNVLDPIKNKIFAAQDSVKDFFFPPKGEKSRKDEQSDTAK